MATFKHISSKNADYGTAEAYLTFEYDEFSRETHGVAMGSYIQHDHMFGDETRMRLCVKKDKSVEIEKTPNVDTRCTDG